MWRAVRDRRRVVLRWTPEGEEEQGRAADADECGDQQRLARVERERQVECVVERPLAGPDGAERDAHDGDGDDVLVALGGGVEEEPVLEVVGEERHDHERAHPAVGQRSEEPERPAAPGARAR